ncbi:uncharacterized protein At3g43530-like [Brassica napus]|uniref:uncharacterized protein At3g43530-like n=1 Tax=Brassica napus TaxID=3708 RepID=UPI0020795C7D|nr:uncharacterized protein At3g43530-like [Brassica napus]
MKGLRLGKGMKGLKRKCPSTGGGVSSRTRGRKAVSNGNEPVREESNPVRGTTVVSLSLDTESEGISAVSSKERQPPQPLEMYFENTQYLKTCKIQTKCRVKKIVDVINELKEEVGWFTSHPQFCHFFHMPDEEFLKLQGMWMLLLHTIRIEGEDAAWFAVNGVPIRYSMREHALISGLDCHEYPSGHLKLGVTIEDVKQKLQSMGTACNDRLKMAVVFFLGRVIRGTTKDSAPLDPFILRIVDDLDVCRNFPWGRLTFEDAIKEIKHVMELLKGEVHHATGFNGFIIPLEVLVFECIPKLGKKFRISSDGASGDCPRMCKSQFTKSSMKGYPLEDIYDAVGKTKVINSVLVPTVDEETLLARIIDLEPEYHREGSTSDRWNYWLNVKQKKIWWKELYESDVAARKFTKTEDKEKVTIVEGSSSNSGLESMLKGVEERIVKAMEEGFSGINLTVETKLEAMNWTMGKPEKNRRVLKKKAKKIEDWLTSIEIKGNEDEEYRQWNDFDYGRDHGKDREMAEAEKDKENAETWKKNSEKGEEDEENSGKDEERGKE